MLTMGVLINFYVYERKSTIIFIYDDETGEFHYIKCNKNVACSFFQLWSTCSIKKIKTMKLTKLIGVLYANNFCTRWSINIMLSAFPITTIFNLNWIKVLRRSKRESEEWLLEFYDAANLSLFSYFFPWLNNTHTNQYHHQHESLKCH